MAGGKAMGGGGGRPIVREELLNSIKGY